MAGKTKLAFHAKITGITVRSAKEQTGTGRFELGLLIEQPSPPKPPTIPWEFATGADRAEWKPRPAAPEPDDEQDPPVELLRQIEHYDQARAAYDSSFADYQVRVGDYRGRIRAYAGLVGIAAVFGNQSVNVVITPANQDLLPGFVAELADPRTEAPLDDGRDDAEV